MNKIALAYSDLYNAGDLMNVDIVEKLSGKKVVRSKTYCAEMTAIGGALNGLQYDEKIAKRMCQHLLKCLYRKKPIYIWGSGFLHDYSNRILYRQNLHVCALRGVKTQGKLKELTGIFYDVPLADGGLLIDLLMTEKPEKKYRMGLIPHMWHQGEPAIVELSEKKGVHLIDIKQPPQKVAYEIAQCETVASTSLHGLVFSDALHVPNAHIVGERELRGGNFKYEDYYSAFGLKDRTWDLKEHLPSYEEIICSYQIDSDAVEKKKKELIECFPRF